jgi:peptidoglycan/LPS O-acetylase OafA/YrhL
MAASPAVYGRAQLNPLTSLRFVAAMSVVVFHFGRPLLGHLPRAVVNVADAGYVGVSFFFVLSGFVLAYAYTNLDSGNVTAVRSFFSARVARIYPAYIVSTLLCAPFVIASLSTKGSPAVSAHALCSSLEALAVLQGWFPVSCGLWNFPAWSLSVELFLYCAFPFAIARIRRAQLPRALFLTFGAAAVSALLLDAPSTYPSLHALHRYCPLPLLHLPQFLFGAVLGVHFTRNRALLDSRAAAAVSLGSAGALFLVLAASPYIPVSLLKDGGLAPLFGALIYSLACGGGPLAAALSRPSLVKLGNASYALYVFQVPVHDWAMRFRAFRPSKSAHVLIYFGALIAVSLAAHALVERPGRQLILDLTDRLFAPGQVVAWRRLIARRRQARALRLPAPGVPNPTFTASPPPPQARESSSPR